MIDFACLVIGRDPLSPRPFLVVLDEDDPVHGGHAFLPSERELVPGRGVTSDLRLAQS